MEQNRPQRPTGMPQHPAHRPSIQPPHPSQSAQPNAPHPTPVMPSPPPKKSKVPMVIGLIALVLIALIITGTGAMKIMGYINVSTSVKSSSYQAVFLSNNMVYFGKISEINDKYIKMTDIFYLQVQQPTTDQKNQNASQLSLTKLGNELHGPEDSMYINSKEVLFWENLKADGKVTAAIRDYKKK
ncbi:hypothetical protein H0W80_03090 [Candidatus Saccharibacteria bacterium]|nr:hypothetical protein [Candidatus Saccharibacteria bacterium]